MISKAIPALLALSLAAPVYADDSKWQVANLSDGDALNVRRGPSTAFEVVMKLPAGYAELRKYECVYLKPEVDKPAQLPLPEWCAISEGEGPIGWVNAKYLAPAPAETEALPFASGYRGDDDPCRIVGESAETANYLDDSSTLVGCPPELVSTFIAEMGGSELTTLHGTVLIAVPDTH